MPLLIAIIASVVCCVIADLLCHKMFDLLGVSGESRVRKVTVFLAMLIAIGVCFFATAVHFMRPI